MASPEGPDRQDQRTAKRQASDAAHALVQFSESLGPGQHVPCEVLGKEEDGRLVVQVVGCEPYDLKARLAEKAVARTKEGERWQWQPGTVHLSEDCDECRARSRGR